jgi:hypothetical protein
VVPAFVVRWFKKTSLGAIRSAMQPNRRIQDGVKHYWMCAACEGKLSDWEGAFRNQVFAPASRPVLEKPSIEYGEWCLKFAASVTWRVLHALRLGEPEVYSANELAKADRAADVWRNFMLGHAENPGAHALHILHVDTISAFGGAVSAYLNRYLLRSIDCDYLTSSSLSLIYAKLGRFVILGVVDGGSKQLWRDSKVHVNRGRIATPSRVPEELRPYLSERAEIGARLHRDLSPNQKKVVRRMFETVDDDAIAANEMVRAMRADLENAGDDAYRVTGEDPDEHA